MGKIGVMATVGRMFDFKVFSRRFGHDDNYSVTLEEDGWTIVSQGMGGKCDPDGNPGLYANFRQDSIHHSDDVGSGFAWLYKNRMDLSDQEMQDGLQRLADWVSETERGTPLGGAFEGLW